MNGDPEIGNLNSNLKNSIAESSLECNSPDCGDSLNSSLLFQLNNSLVSGMVECYRMIIPHLHIHNWKIAVAMGGE